MEYGTTVQFPTLQAGGVKRARVVDYSEKPFPSLHIPFEGKNWQIIPAGSGSVVRFNSREERLEMIPVNQSIETRLHFRWLTLRLRP